MENVLFNVVYMMLIVDTFSLVSVSAVDRQSENVHLRLVRRRPSYFSTHVLMALNGNTYRR